MFANKNSFLTAGTVTPVPYSITNSLRFRTSANAYLIRTPSSTGNTTKFTRRYWIKRGVLGVTKVFDSAGTSGTNVDQITFDSNNALNVESYRGGYNFRLITSMLFRDPAAWYDIVIAFDTTQGTASDRVKIYVNGVQVTSFSTATYPSASYATYWNTISISNALGNQLTNTGSTNYDGYMAEVIGVDGQQLTPSNFGQFSSTTGAWIPIAYSGSYGTNGFYLDFSTTTSATTLCYDKSGNGNNWTPNNISVTSGETYDSMLDTPTKNYPVINPIPYSNYSGSIGNYLSQGNLKITAGALAGTNTVSTFAIPVYGKWYCEATTTVAGGTIVGWFGVNTVNSDNSLGPNFSGLISRTVAGNGYYQNGTLVNGGTFGVVNAWFGIAVDRTTLPGTVTIYINGASPYTVNAPSGDIFFEISQYSGGIGTVNFGQQPWQYSPPSGFVSLCTANMTAPTIANGANYFAATTYTGNGSTNTITNTVNSASFKPDLVWIKARSNSWLHRLVDAMRGVGISLESDQNYGNQSEPNGVTAFNSNGFSLAGDANYNNNTNTYVAWQWKASNAAYVTNTAGTITSQVMANPTAGFSIVQYTGNGVSGATVGHGLGAAPRMIIAKMTDGAMDWAVLLVRTDPPRILNTFAAAAGAALFTTTNPTSSVFSIGPYIGTNYTSHNFIAYCFSEIAGFSTFGTYTGNGLTDGPFIYCGFRPRWVMWKRTDAIGDWIIEDTTRSPNNANDTTLYPNLSVAESSGGGYSIDFLSNGFKIRNSAAYSNASSGVYYYAAFAECPFQYANAR